MRHSKRLAIVVACLLASSAAALYEAQSVPAMVTTANAFLASLTPEQRDQATFDFDPSQLRYLHRIMLKGGRPKMAA